MSTADKALNALRYFPRVKLNNLYKLPTDKPKTTKVGRGKGKKYGKNNAKQGLKHHCRWMPLGFEFGNWAFNKSAPIERAYNFGYHAIRQYPPLSLKTLQLLIDTGRVNPEEPIDLAQICNTKVINIDPHDSNHFGINLTEEGMDCFDAKVNIEVQWASEASIAAIEKNGGVITTAYFDRLCVKALSDAKLFFLRGHPIPKRLTPPADCIGYYTNAANRGYLADPRKIAIERIALAQKYGYELPDINQDENKEMLLKTKDPRQCFYGLEPGWIISLQEKLIYKPIDKKLDEYYTT